MTTTTTDRTSRIGDFGIKAPVAAATTAAITLSGLQTIDGVALTAGLRVLVKNQASSVDNGIYVADTGTWSRAVDFDGAYDCANGTLVSVTGGSTNTGLWSAAGTDPITPGTSAITFTAGVTAGFIQPLTSAVSRTAQSKMADWVSILDFMTTAQITDFLANTATLDLSAPIQAAASSGAKGIFTPAGTALIGTPILSPSNVEWFGVGEGSKWKAKSTLTALSGWPATVYALLANSDINAGNSGIRITEMSFDMSARDVAAAHAIHLRNVDNCHVNWNSFLQGDDGCAMTKATRSSIVNNYAKNCANAAYDMWETCSDCMIAFNTVYADGSGRGQLAAILVTGLSILNIAGTSTRVRVIGNMVYGTQQGIWLQGGVFGAQIGSTTDCMVEHNTIAHIISYHGIRASEGSGHIINGNRIVDTWASGIAILGEQSAGAAGAAQNCVISNNYLSSINQSTNAGNDGIQIANSGNGNLVVGNIVFAGSQKYSLSFASTVSGCREYGNILGAGATGIINDVAGVNGYVNFMFTNAAGTVFNAAGPTDIPFATTVHNQGGGFATPTFTAPRTGKYQFDFKLTYTNASTVGNQWDISLVGTSRTQKFSHTIDTAQVHTLCYACTLDMTAGDTAKLTMTRAAGAGTFTLVADATQNSFSGFLVKEYA